MCTDLLFLVPISDKIVISHIYQSRVASGTLETQEEGDIGELKGETLEWEGGGIVTSKKFSGIVFNHRFQTFGFMLLNVKFFRKNTSILNTVDIIVD